MKIYSKILWLFTCILLVAIDFYSKQWAIDIIAPCQESSAVYPYGGIGVFQGIIKGIDFSLGYVENSGAAFGILANYPKLLFVLRTLLILILAGWFFFSSKVKSNRFAWLLILSGAIGNWIDMVFYGVVIDFLNFHFFGYAFPLFNFADAFITIGALCIILNEIFFSKKSER